MATFTEVASCIKCNAERIDGNAYADYRNQTKLKGQKRRSSVGMLRPKNIRNGCQCPGASFKSGLDKG